MIIAVAHAAADTLRSQITDRCNPDSVPVLYDPRSVTPLRCQITEPDAFALDGPLRPLAGHSLGVVADTDGQPRWAQPAPPALPTRSRSI